MPRAAAVPLLHYGPASMAALVAVVLVAVPDVAQAYVELALVQCDSRDPKQLWSMPPHGLGYGGTLIHQSTKLCLMPQDCDVDVGTPLVLDECNSTCVQRNPSADEFTLHHNRGSAPRALVSQAVWADGKLPSNFSQRLFATALSRAPALALMPWNAMSPAHQQWMTATPFKGPDHVLQVGTAKDEPPLCDVTGRESDGCCLGVLDEGWGPILAEFAPVVGGVLLATVVAGVISNGLRKRKADSALGDGNDGDSGPREPPASVPPDYAPQSALFDPLIVTEWHDVGTKPPPQHSDAEVRMLMHDAWVPVPEPPQLGSSVDIGSAFDGIEATDGQLNISDDVRIWTSIENSIEVNSTSDNAADGSGGADAASNHTVALSANHATLSAGENATQEKLEDLTCVQTEAPEDDLTSGEALLFAANLSGSPCGAESLDCDTGTPSLQAASSSVAPVAVPAGGQARVKRKYCCPFPGCGHTSDREGHLADHIKTHTGEKPFACPFPGCTYRSAGKGHITRHVRSHTKEKPYRCTYPGCDFASSQSNHVTTHMRKHTGERPFRCDLDGCDYTAARAWLVSRHKATRHGISTSGGKASTTRAPTSVETHPANDAEHAQTASDESVEVCSTTPEASTPPAPPLPPLSQPSRTQTQQIVVTAHAVEAAELSLGTSAAEVATAKAAQVASTTPDGGA